MQRSWRSVLADESVRKAIEEAARECHAEVDDCDPELCAHSDVLMMPIGLPQWIDQEVLKERGKPIRLDHHENRSAGQQHRRALEFSASA